VGSTDAPTVRLKDVAAGGDVKITTNLQVFVGATSREISVLPDGSLRIAEAGETAAISLDENPYKGLEAFTEADADRYFGREDSIEQLWQRCRDLGHEAVGETPLRLLPVIGPSGCGKSSLVRAGLLLELARRPLTGLDRSRVAVLVPTSHPLDAIAAVLAPMITGDPLAMAKQKEIVDTLLARDPDGAYHGLRRVVRFLTAAGRPLIILVDQFEEVWSLCESPAEQAAFIANLLDVATERDARVSVVLTLRSDFLRSTSADTELSHAISRRAYLVPSMSEEQLRCAIVEPARKGGFEFDKATVDLMISQTEGREGALPLLQFALTRIWEGLKAGVSAAETLRHLGGVGGALAKEAEQVYRGLADADQRIVRRAFLAQVRLGEGTRDTRRRAPLDEIVAQGEDRDHVLDLLRHFSRTDQRFITLSGDPSQGRVTAELCHEALLEHWDSLKKWVDEGRSDLRFQRRVAEAADDWQAQSKPNGLLWRSPQLDLLRNFYRRNAADMPRLQIAFYQASERYQKLQRLYRYGTLVIILLAILSATLLAFALSILYFNWEQTRPWARLVRLSTGHSYPLRQSLAHVGRETSGTRLMQVDLPERRISRIHLGISNIGTITDWRSFYGTTVNAKWLRYGDSLHLYDGDILVLSGLEVLRYRTIEWQPSHYLRAPVLSDEPVPGGWATLIDGQRRQVLSIPSDEVFVVAGGDGVALSDHLTSEAVLAVRRRMFHAGEPLSVRKIDVVAFADAKQASVNYSAISAGPGLQACVVKNDELVLTLQPVSVGSGQNFSSWIKEGDLNRRQIVMPTDTETAILLEDKEQSPHGLGELMFETAAGAFQIVPTATIDVVEICAPLDQQ
jgi:hypothetical protein